VNNFYRKISSKLLAKSLLAIYVCTLIFQFGVHEELHHRKYNIHDIELCLNDAHCCHHESIETHCVHHVHIDVVKSDCDFCDQFFHQVFYVGVVIDYSLSTQFLSQDFGSYADQCEFTFFTISRNKSPPIFIS